MPPLSVWEDFMANSEERKRKAMIKAKLAKKTAMHENGERSRYFTRVQARLRGEPMSTRAVMPWWYAEFSRVFSGLKAA